jgi:hypothetical protein
MKLRIKGQSIRLRVSRSELERFMQGERIQETIYFAPEEGAQFTYALEQTSDSLAVLVRPRGSEVTVIVPQSDALAWGTSDRVGIYGSIDLGLRGSLEFIIEKDFACLDLSDAENKDTFPNPSAGATC